jgi:transposase
MDAITAAHEGDIQMIDSTPVRAHQQAATEKRGVQITVSVDHAAGSRPKSMSSSTYEGFRSARPNGWADARRADRGRAARPSRPPTIVLADKAYDADRIREMIQNQGATPDIPPKSNRRWKPCFSKRLYRERHLIERFFSKLKHFRRVATRYDKRAANLVAMVQLASIRLWLRAYESTA